MMTTIEHVTWTKVRKLRTAQYVILSPLGTLKITGRYPLQRELRLWFGSEVGNVRKLRNVRDYLKSRFGVTDDGRQVCTVLRVA